MISMSVNFAVDEKRMRNSRSLISSIRLIHGCLGALFTGFRRGNLILPWRAGTKKMEGAPFHRVRNRCALLRPRNPYGPESQGSADRLSRRREGLRRALLAGRDRGNGASLALAAPSAAPARSSP